MKMKLYKTTGLLAIAALTTTIILSYAYVGYTQEEDGGWETGERLNDYSAPNSGDMGMSTIDTSYDMPPTTDYMPTDFSSSMSTGLFNQPGEVPPLPTFPGYLEEGVAEGLVPVPSLPTFSGSLEEVVQELYSTQYTEPPELKKIPDQPAPPEPPDQPQPGIYQIGKDVYIIPEDKTILGEFKTDSKGRNKWFVPNQPPPPQNPSNRGLLDLFFGGDKKK